MKRVHLCAHRGATLLVVPWLQVSKAVYVSLPGPGNIQDLADVVAKEKLQRRVGVSNVTLSCCAAPR